MVPKGLDRAPGLLPCGVARRARPGRWSAKPPEAEPNLGGYRAAAPDPEGQEGELDFEPSGEYVALRESWIRRLFRRVWRGLT